MNLKELEKEKEPRAKMPVVIDFDSTVVTNRFPEVGDEVPHCVEVLKKWQDRGVGLVLSTMRSEKALREAVEWFAERGIDLYGVQKDPTQEQWTDSPKANGLFCIDDRNLGTPKVVYAGDTVVDWKAVDELYTDEVLAAAAKYSFKEWLTVAAK